MTDDTWQHALEIFEAASDRSGPDRARWLDEACDGDAALRDQVERLLRAHEQQGLLDRPPVPGDADIAERLGRALGDRYRISQLIGRGGSAVVFLAEERKHARQVVLKVLDPEVAKLWGPERFQREVQIAARLAHPHIVGLIDSGDADGLLYYVMPYVEGETLRVRLDRTGALRYADALPLLRDVAQALAYAHSAGVVHRDLKPANVLCVGAHAFLMDFGVAKLVQRSAITKDKSTSGAAVGTPAYMAPEQRAALPVLDHKVDLYAWGLLAAESLTGRLPQQLRESTAALGDAPAAVAALVSECLAQDPAARPADADTILRRLEEATPRRRWTLGVAGAVLAAVAFTIGFRDRVTRSGATPALRVPLAVAPFRNETGDSALTTWGRMAGDWLTQGLQESGLAAMISWPAALEASVLPAGAEETDLARQLNRKTGANTVVTGAYYAVGDSLQFRAQVSNAVTGEVLSVLAPVTAARATPQAAFPLLRERVLGAVAVLADEEFPRAVGLRQRPPTYEAYRAFELGSQRFTRQDYAGAVPLLRQAHALDTTFMVPLLNLVSAWWNEAEFDSVGRVLAQLHANEPALNPYQRLQLEYYDDLYSGDMRGAYDVLSRAAQLAPDSRAGYNVALLALSLDRPREALAALESLEPARGALGDWSSYWSQLAHALHQLGEHGREREAVRTLIRRFPDRRVGLALEARALAAQGDTAEIDRVLAAAEPLPPSTYWSQGAAMVTAGEELMAHGRVAAGTRYLERAVAWFEAQLQLEPGQRGHRYWLGSAYYDLGRWKDASVIFEALEREFPDRRDYHALAVISGARMLGRSTASQLGEPRPWGRGANAFQRARIAAASGDIARAKALFTEAVGIGIEGLPWLHATAVRDLLDLGPEVTRLPPGLRITPAGPGTAPDA